MKRSHVFSLFATLTLVAVAEEKPAAPPSTRALLKNPESWFATDEAKTIATNLLSYQSDFGGWPRHATMTAAPYTGRPGDLKDEFKPFLDDGATLIEVRFMASMYRATQDSRYLLSAENGINFLLIAQDPTGAWPQVYPPDKRKLVVDEATESEILTLLEEIANTESFGFLNPNQRRAAQVALQRHSEPNWQPKVRIALAGDSTVTDGAGWGFGFKKQLDAETLCVNLASGGQSSKSFRDTGQWAKALAFDPDYVLIQFGHNDMPGKGPNRETDPATTYAENSTRFIAEARAIGAKPILVTSLTRRIFEADGKMRGELAPYAEAARKVAVAQDVPLIDLFALSVALVEKLGPAGVEPFEPMSPPKPTAAAPKPAPRRDGTHLTARGSLVFGEIVADELASLVPETGGCFRRSAAVENR